MSKLLKIEDTIQIKASLGLDEVGRVFSIRDENKYVYRNINIENKEFYINLLELIKKDHQLQNFIIETNVSEYTNPANEIILQHEKIQHVNYPWEWGREMLKQAALMFIDLNIELVKNGYFTKDSHSFNIIYKDNKPLFVDLGSIIKNTSSLSIYWLKEFELFFLLPLFYFSMSEGKAYRSVYLPGNGFTLQDYKKSFQDSIKSFSKYRQYFSSFYIMFLLHMKIAKANNKVSQISFLKYLRKKVENIHILYPQTSWSDYSSKKSFVYDPNTWDNKQKVILDIAKNVKVKSVVDLAGNTGFYLDVFKHYNKNVIEYFLFDYDEVCIDLAFKENKYITFNIDFLNIGKHITESYMEFNYELDSIDERIKGDLVLALALTHHLVFWQNCSFENIAQKLSLITNNYCAVEFISKEDKYVCEWYSEKYEWYTLDNFILSLEKYFSIIKVYDSNPEHRFIIFCKKIRTSN